ncbi:MAG: hypothetical protein EZS28_010753 [Streblomastix strix]|uniref:Tyr recombinase domain-containing protein n=1 Tax=Streblomastix strix TaxID=222440 RepID=A0A5J4WFF5_9EUKA|nr:MAG: hypothetical protein EZS28_010753 [Streblomastix strix]
MRTRLTEQSVEVVIKAMSTESWRKRKVGVHLIEENIDEKNLSLDEMKDVRPDVIMVNKLTWRNEKRGVRSVADMQKIRAHGWEGGKQKISYSIALFVVFMAARMTELTRMKRKDILIDGQRMMLQTKIKKSRKLREYMIELKRQGTENCPVGALDKWMKDENC